MYKVLDKSDNVIVVEEIDPKAHRHLSGRDFDPKTDNLTFKKAAPKPAPKKASTAKKTTKTTKSTK